jgi:tetratricopeptide (TPR) repeat protein
MGAPRSGAALAGLISLVLLAAPVRADPGDRAEARREFEKGRVAYHLADYEEAIAHFTHAYQLSLEPVLIFNIAQAQRMVGRCQKAIDLYQQYLRLVPASEEADAARSHLESLRATCRVEAEEPATKAKSSPPAPAPALPSRAAPVESVVVSAAPGQGLRRAAWAGLAGGALVAAAAPLLYRWNESRKAKRDVESAALARVLPTDATDPDARTRLEQSNRALDRSIHTTGTMVIVTAGVGTAAMLTSAAYLLFAREPASTHRAGLTPAVAIAPGLAHLGLAGAF